MKIADQYKSLIKLLGFLAFALLLAYGNNYGHENAHKQIAITHGCVEFTMEVHLSTPSYFSCLDYNDRTEEVQLQEKKLHSLNEILSYNLDTFMFLVVLIGAFLVHKNGKLAKKPETKRKKRKGK